MTNQLSQFMQALQLQQAAAPPAVPAQPAAPAYDPEASLNQILGDLDPNDPQFKEKSEVRKAFARLGQLAQQAQAESPDIMKMHEALANEYKQHKFRGYHPLQAFALGFGGHGDQVARDQRYIADSEEAQRLELLRMKEQALRGHYAQLMEQGKFKQALGQSALMEELAATRRAQEHEQKLALQKAKDEEAMKRQREITRRAGLAADHRAKMASKDLGKLPEALKLRYKNELDAAKALYAQMTRPDAMTGAPPDNDQIMQAAELYRKSVEDIEDRLDEELKGRSQGTSAAEAPAADKAAVEPGVKVSDNTGGAYARWKASRK